jgi:hypothetical protein
MWLSEPDTKRVDSTTYHMKPPLRQGVVWIEGHQNMGQDVLLRFPFTITTIVIAVPGMSRDFAVMVADLRFDLQSS